MLCSIFSEEAFVIRYLIDLIGEEIIATSYDKELQKQVKNNLE